MTLHHTGLASQLAVVIRRRIQPGLEQLQSATLRETVVEDLTLGDVPPTVSAIKVYATGDPDTFIADLVHHLGPCGPDERGCRPRFTQAQSIWWHGGAFVLALGIIGRRTTRAPWRRAAQTGRGPVSESTAVLVLFGLVLLLNAGVTGALSGPFARYQARLAWLVPLGAMLVLSPGTWQRLRKGVGGPASRD